MRAVLESSGRSRSSFDAGRSVRSPWSGAVAVVRAIFAENEENETKVSLVAVIDVECDHRAV